MMKPKPAPIIALLAGVLLIGCESNPANLAPRGASATNADRFQPEFPQAPDSSTKLNGVRIGMTREEVQSVLGKPDSMSAQANAVYLTYYLLNTGSDFERHQPYMIRLINGRVESFGRFSELADLYNRPVVARIAATAPDLATEFKSLKDLKDQGALTDEEFQKAKAKLLAQL
jgi:hypothetical protein